MGSCGNNYHYPVVSEKKGKRLSGPSYLLDIKFLRYLIIATGKCKIFFFLQESLLINDILLNLAESSGKKKKHRERVTSARWQSRWSPTQALLTDQRATSHRQDVVVTFPGPGVEA